MDELLDTRLTPALARSLPNFMIIGAPKSATTSLYRYLGQHPDIFMSRVKEPAYFALDAEYRKGLAYYARYFRSGRKVSARGEASPGYLGLPEVSDRIARDLPTEAHRFIVLLRNPIDRAYSQYWHNVRGGIERRSFVDALAQEPEPRTIREYGDVAPAYIWFGRYAQHLRRWTNRFGRDAILVLFQEDLQHDPQAVAAETFQFLGVSSMTIDARKREGAAGESPFGLNARLATSSPRVKKSIRAVVPARMLLRISQFVAELPRRPAPYAPMRREVAAQLADALASDVLELERLTGRDLQHWLKPA
jgi:hypothetical protein